MSKRINICRKTAGGEKHDICLFFVFRRILFIYFLGEKTKSRIKTIMRRNRRSERTLLFWPF